MEGSAVLQNGFPVRVPSAVDCFCQTFGARIKVRKCQPSLAKAPKGFIHAGDPAPGNFCLVIVCCIRSEPF